MIENFKTPNDPFVQETSKTSEIRDNFGKVRFKVYLIDMLDYYEEKTNCDDRFNVSVYSLCYSLEPYQILNETFADRKSAYDFYTKCVENYRHIVLIETKDFLDIAIYADKINYHKIEPECCANCKYSKVCEADKPCDCNDLPPHMQHMKKNRRRLICMNSQIFAIDEEHEQFKKECHDNHCHHDHRHDHMPHHMMSDIQPKVDDNGICDYYESRNSK